MREEKRRIGDSNGAKTEKNAPALGDLVYGSHVSLLGKKLRTEKNPLSARLPANPASSHARPASEQHGAPLTGTSKSSASDMVGLLVKIGRVPLGVARQSPARRRETESRGRRPAHAPRLPASPRPPISASFLWRFPRGCGSPDFAILFESLLSCNYRGMED